MCAQGGDLGASCKNGYFVTRIPGQSVRNTHVYVQRLQPAPEGLGGVQVFIRETFMMLRGM